MQITSLEEYISTHGRMSVDGTRKLAEDILAAIGDLHGANLIHGDLQAGDCISCERKVEARQCRDSHEGCG